MHRTNLHTEKNKQSLLARRSKLSVLNLLLTVTDSIFLSHILVPYIIIIYLPKL